MQNNSNLLQVLSFTAEQTKSLADANSVLGDALTADGKTVIPVSEISVGFAGGGADAADGKRTRQPAGAGSKVKRTPVGFLVIDEQGAHMLSAAEPQKQNPLATLFSLFKKK